MSGHMLGTVDLPMYTQSPRAKDVYMYQVYYVCTDVKQPLRDSGLYIRHRLTQTPTLLIIQVRTCVLSITNYRKLV